MNKSEQSILIVDNDKRVLNALQTSLYSVSDNISIFSSPLKCIDSITFGKHDLLITDINMPEMDGLTLLKRAKEIDPGLAVLVITGYSQVPLAVESVKLGAEDFIEKPFGHIEITGIVKNILSNQLANGRANLRKLSKTEIVILSYIVEGFGNSGIAHELSRSVRTVEDHRYNLMLKLEVDNIVELVHCATELGFGKSKQKQSLINSGT